MFISLDELSSFLVVLELCLLVSSYESAYIFYQRENEGIRSRVRVIILMLTYRFSHTEKTSQQSKVESWGTQPCFFLTSLEALPERDNSVFLIFLKEKNT